MTKPRALLALPSNNIRRWAMFSIGLQRAGYEVVQPRHHDRPLEPTDVLVTWNVRKQDAELIEEARAAGTPHIVAENGYLGRHSTGRDYVAMALDGHNGSGRWPEDDAAERWRRMEVKLYPWKDDGDWILLVTQRGIGAPGMAMPSGWETETVDALRQRTSLHVEVRRPPSRAQPRQKLYDLFERACCIVVWTSNTATLGLVRGIPAVYAGPTHICAPAMQRLGETDPGNPWKGDREAAFRRVAAAQWLYEEVESGEVFKRLAELETVQ